MINFTEFVSEFLCRSNPVIALEKNKANLCIAIGGLYFPHGGDCIAVILIHKTLPHSVFDSLFAAAVELCRKPVAFVIIQFQILTVRSRITSACRFDGCKICSTPCTLLSVVHIFGIFTRAIIRWTVMLAGSTCIIIPEIDIVGIISWEYPVLIGRTRYTRIIITAR